MLQSPQLNVLGRFGERMSVYWATDSFASGSSLMGANRQALLAAEQAAASRADLVVAVSDRLARTWSERGKRTIVITHGVNIPPRTEFDKPNDLVLGRPIAGVVGTLSGRLDFEILERVADSVSVVLIGPLSFRTDRTAFDRLCERPNVAWLNAKNHSDLVAYYQHIDVGLVPYTLSDFNLDSAPLKPLEYLAVGLPVVSTRLPAVAAIESPDIVIADDAAGFASAVEAAVRIRGETELIGRRRRHVCAWSRDARAVEVLAALRQGQG